jgi:tyrosyl-tRNA synthetase
MFGKLMSVSDDMMWRYWLLLSDRTETEIADLRRAVEAGARHPMEVKKELAELLVTEFHSAQDGAAARLEFERVFGGGQLPQDIPELELAAQGETAPLARVLVEAGLAASNSEARRLIQQGGVKVEGEPVTDIKAEVGTLSVSGHPVLVQVGKRRIARVRFTRG